MQDIIYLDNAATSFPKPDAVHDAVRDFYRDNGVNPGRTGCDLAVKAEQMIHNTRKRLSAFFNASLVEAGQLVKHAALAGVRVPGQRHHRRCRDGLDPDQGVASLGAVGATTHRASPR